MTWTLQTLSPTQATTEREAIDATEEHVIDLPGVRLTFGTREGAHAVLVEMPEIAVIGIAAPDLLDLNGSAAAEADDGCDVLDILDALDAEDLLRQARRAA
ncbi:hypothetical protein [Insolitispirillum peregrinum]|uniref:hypothetical protein n=1 Tax=Insolitispirillum peregrinum TaxID=80876 RepID=UPI003607A48B